MTYTKYAVVTSMLALLLTGCTGNQAMVAPIMKTVTLADGKNYSVPEHSTYTQKAVTPKAIKFFKSVGATTCKEGDITWEDKATANSINEIMRTGTKDEGIATYKEAVKTGKMGCASPIQ